MAVEPMVSARDGRTRLGLFWRLPDGEGGRRFVGFSRHVEDIPEIGGFKTYEPGHAEVWPLVTGRRQELRERNYEEFPRGRVNLDVSKGSYLLLMDRRLMTPPFVSIVVNRWSLPRERTHVLSDEHYR